MSDIEDEFAQQIQLYGFPAPEREYRFAKPRRFRFDFAWPDVRLAVEIEGGTWAGGRHVTGAGYARDCEKYNLATIMGWRVLRYTGDMVRSGVALGEVEMALEAIREEARR